MANPLTSAIADAITKQEGWFPGSASQRNNNPGNIMDIGYYQQTGQFKLATYPTLEAGRAALESLVDKYISAGHTLNSFFAKYAPSGHGGNNPSTYAANVASWLGIPADVPLSQVSASGGATAAQNGPGAGAGVDAGGLAPGASEDGAGAGEGGYSYTPLLAALGVAGAIWWWMAD